MKPNRYETRLSADQEPGFWEWLKKEHDAGNILQNDYSFYMDHGFGYDYDFRAAYAAGLKPGENGHWPDIGKKPNHPTFSVESKYAKESGTTPGRWEGERFIPGTPTSSGWQLPTLSDIPAVHEGKPVHFKNHKDNFLFRFLKSMSMGRIDLDKSASQDE